MGGEDPTVEDEAWLSPGRPRPSLCPQGLALRAAERRKLTRARLHHRRTLLRGALRTWAVGAAAGLGRGCGGWILCPSQSACPGQRVSRPRGQAPVSLLGTAKTSLGAPASALKRPLVQEPSGLSE